MPDGLSLDVGMAQAATLTGLIGLPTEPSVAATTIAALPPLGLFPLLPIFNFGRVTPTSNLQEVEEVRRLTKTRACLFDNREYVV